MSDKAKLEEQWQRPGVARPKHSTQWSEGAEGELVPAKGKPMKPDDPGKAAQKKRLEYK